MNLAGSNRNIPNRKQYKITLMQKKVLQTLAKKGCTLRKIYDACTYGTTQSQTHCHRSITTLLRRGYIDIKVGAVETSEGQRALYTITQTGREALNSVLEATTQ